MFLPKSEERILLERHHIPNTSGSLSRTEFGSNDNTVELSFCWRGPKRLGAGRYRDLEIQKIIVTIQSPFFARFEADLMSAATQDLNSLNFKRWMVHDNDFAETVSDIASLCLNIERLNKLEVSGEVCPGEEFPIEFNIPSEWKVCHLSELQSRKYMLNMGHNPDNPGKAYFSVIKNT